MALSLICSFANCAVNNVTCPEEKDITPCVCYPHSAQIYCVGPNIDESHITKVGPKIKTENGLFHILLIRETKLKTIPKHAFSGAEFVKIYVESKKIQKYLKFFSRKKDFLFFLQITTT